MMQYLRAVDISIIIDFIFIHHFCYFFSWFNVNKQFQMFICIHYVNGQCLVAKTRVLFIIDIS